MSQMNEELVRAEHAHRVEHALEGVEARRVARVMRRRRQAERAARRARLALGRSL